MPVEWSKEEHGDAVIVTVPVPTRAKDWEFWVLVQSDVHWDNTKCQRALYREDLERAKQRGAAILDNGDFFCAMQGKGDPRSGKESLRYEHAKPNYLQALVTTASKYLEPYAENLVWMARGNHELSVLDRREFDLTGGLCESLKARTGQDVFPRPICGWTKIRFEQQSAAAHPVTCTYRLYHHHGYGGGGPVTRDVIQANRQGVYLDGADLVVSGHTHDAWVFPTTVATLGVNCRAQTKQRWHIKTPTYKYEFGKGGWTDLKGHPPKPIGCAWLRFTAPRNASSKSRRIQVQVIHDLHDMNAEQDYTEH